MAWSTYEALCERAGKRLPLIDTREESERIARYINSPWTSPEGIESVWRQMTEHHVKALEERKSLQALNIRRVLKMMMTAVETCVLGDDITDTLIPSERVYLRRISARIEDRMSELGGALND